MSERQEQKTTRPDEKRVKEWLRQLEKWFAYNDEWSDDDKEVSALIKGRFSDNQGGNHDK